MAIDGEAGRGTPPLEPADDDPDDAPEPAPAEPTLEPLQAEPPAPDETIQREIDLTDESPAIFVVEVEVEDEAES